MTDHGIDKDPNKFAGKSSIKEDSNGNLLVTGYQIYKYNPETRQILTNNSKLSVVESKLNVAGKDIIDLGANVGLFSLYAVTKKAYAVLAVESDSNCVEVIKKLQEYHPNLVVLSDTSISELSAVGDITFAFGLIHWIYSCTEQFGSLGSIAKKMREITRETLYIEWIDPRDSLVREYGHLRYNKDKHVGEYNIKNFKKEFEERFSSVKPIGSTGTHREIYECKV